MTWRGKWQHIPLISSQCARFRNAAMKRTPLQQNWAGYRWRSRPCAGMLACSIQQRVPVIDYRTRKPACCLAARSCSLIHCWTSWLMCQHGDPGDRRSPHRRSPQMALSQNTTSTTLPIAATRAHTHPARGVASPFCFLRPGTPILPLGCCLGAAPVAREPWSGCHNSGTAHARGTLFLPQVLEHALERERGGYVSGREHVPQTLVCGSAATW